MNKLYIVFFLGYFVALNGCDTSNNVEPINENFFIKVYSGISQGNQLGSDIIETSDGGLLIGGTSYSEGTSVNESDSAEFLLIKTDLRGDIEWKIGGHNYGLLKSEVKSIIELPNNTYLIGGTVYDDMVNRAILINVDLQGNFIDSAYVHTRDLALNEYNNELKKITLGHSGILVSGETMLPVNGGGGRNGFIKLYDLSLNPIGTGTGVVKERYFGSSGNDIISGAYEIVDTINHVGNEDVRFLVFGSVVPPDNISRNDYDFCYFGITKDFGDPVFATRETTLGNINSNEISNNVTSYNDNFWQIGYTDGSSESQIYLVGWEFDVNNGAPDWDSQLFIPIINTSEAVIGKGISIYDGTNAIIACDVQYSIDNSEVYLAKLDRNYGMVDIWTRTFGTNTSSYSASTVIRLQADGSIVVLGTADLEPIKKIIVIKTGPDGQLSF